MPPLSVFALLIAARLAAMPSLQLREDAPAVAPEQAARMAPVALGNLVLAPGHLPVVEASVGPEGMEPPPPPGGPVATRIKLYLQPVASTQPGFCERTIATLYLQSAAQSARTRAASRPASLSTDVAYRWSGAPSATPCTGERSAYFVPRAGEEAQALAAVRLLAQASLDARRGRPLPFPLSIEDKDGPEMMAFARAHRELEPAQHWTVLTDATKALAALPLDAVQYAGPAQYAWPEILQHGDLDGTGTGEKEAVTIFLRSEWTVGLVLDHQHIVRMRLLRQMARPF